MKKIILPLRVNETNSIIKISSPKDENGVSWVQRFYLKDKPIYEYGPTCESCVFFLKQINNTNYSLTINEIRETLNNNCSRIPDNVLSNFSKMFPKGNYHVIFKEINPNLNLDKELLYSGDDFDVFILNKTDLAPQINTGNYASSKFKVLNFYELIVPIQSSTLLNRKVVADYSEKLKSNHRPCCVSYSFVEVHGRDSWWQIFLVHFLLDGHHKMQASIECKLPINIISFFSHDSASSYLNVLPFIDNRTYEEYEKNKMKSIDFLIKNDLL